MLRKRKTEQPIAFALSVDVEDYYHVSAFSNVIRKDSWDGFEFRVGDMTRACLDLFDSYGAKATFFVLGWVAERDPALVRDIVSRGHELASHGYEHARVNTQTREQFRADIDRTKKLLEDISGVRVSGYRAASFSIDKTTPWAHEALAETGHYYSSSSHPIAHDHYGDAQASRYPYKPLNGSAFLEAPVATAAVLGRRMSCAGGGWFRAAPYFLTRHLLKTASKEIDGPAIFYFHPWEIDCAQPRIKSADMPAKLRHYLNISTMRTKLSRLLQEFEWGRVDKALGVNIKGGE